MWEKNVVSVIFLMTFQINWLVSIWWGILVVNGLTQYTPKVPFLYTWRRHRNGILTWNQFIELISKIIWLPGKLVLYWEYERVLEIICLWKHLNEDSCILWTDWFTFVSFRCNDVRQYLVVNILKTSYVENSYSNCFVIS